MALPLYLTGPLALIGDLAVKSRLRAAHDTLNPRLVDPETFNLDVTACCREEISLYSRDMPSPLPRGQCSGADHLRACSRSRERSLLQFRHFKNIEIYALVVKLSSIIKLMNFKIIYPSTFNNNFSKIDSNLTFNNTNNEFNSIIII